MLLTKEGAIMIRQTKGRLRSFVHEEYIICLYIYVVYSVMRLSRKIVRGPGNVFMAVRTSQEASK